MDRKKEELKESIPKGITPEESILDIPEAEIMDFWEEGSEYIMYDRWDKVKDWLKKMFWDC